MDVRRQLKRKQASLLIDINARHKKRVKIGAFRIISSRKTLLGNYNNFRNSGIPARVMYFREGEWMDFPMETTSLLKQAFQSRKSVVEVVMAEISYLVDFLHMIQIDLSTGCLTSIAWIDGNGKCFFPRVVSQKDGELSCPSRIEERIEVHEVDLRINGGAKAEPKVKPLGSRLVVDTEQGKQDPSNSIGDSQSDISSECGSNEGYFHVRDNLVMLGGEEEEFATVRERFMGGMGRIASLTRVVGIYRNSHKSVSGQSRLEAFRSHAEEIGRKSEGNANIRYAWHGTSKSGVSGIVLHGFGQPSTPKNGAAYGKGVYLAPQHCSYISALYSDVDENGEQHMVLCRVIMGNIEQVKPGSHQFHPSSEQFDTGVDDLQNPKRYIIWSTHMNTHILPEYIVSFKVAPQLHEFWSSLKANHYTINRQGSRKYSLQDVQSASPKSIAEKDVDRRPHPAVIKELPQASLPVVQQAQQSSPQCFTDPSEQMQWHNLAPSSSWISFEMLFSVIEKFLSSSTTCLLKKHYADYKASKINREDLVRRLRMIAGDEVLTSAIKMFQDQVSQKK